MVNHPRAGQIARQSDLINVAQLTSQYYTLHPQPENSEHKVKFGTSGHRAVLSVTVLMRRIFWQLLRLLQKFASNGELMALVMWVKIPMLYQNRHLFPYWKC